MDVIDTILIGLVLAVVLLLLAMVLVSVNGKRKSQTLKNLDRQRFD